MLGYFYGDIVGLEGASGLRSDQPCRRRVGKGDEFNKTAPAPPAPAAPAPLRQQQGRSFRRSTACLPLNGILITF